MEGTQAVRLARAARDETRADLLPNLTAHVSETREKVNLAAFGFSGLPGFPDLPTIVGPFNVFDARAAVTQTVLDLHALEKARAGSHSLRAAELAFENTRDLVVLVAGNLYLRVAAAWSSLVAAQEQTAAAVALREVAVDRKQAGVVAGIEVLRAEVQLQQRRERELAAANQVEKAKLDLARAIGLPLGQRFTITDAVAFSPPPPLTVDDAERRAYESRADWKEAQSRVRAAEALRRAARGESLPSLSVSADYGQIGPTLAEARGTYTLNASLHVPVFEGGRAQARVAQAEAALEQRRAEAEDVRARIHYEVQAAFLDLSSAAARVEAAGSALGLAREQVRQAQDRFAAGVTGNIEVVQAQDAMAAAHEAYVTSVYDHNVAKASLARSLGLVEEAFVQFLGGH
jgi:outer membrane protein TolC